eukprot:862867-Amphidinium_carterae.1
MRGGAGAAQCQANVAKQPLRARTAPEKWAPGGPQSGGDSAPAEGDAKPTRAHEYADTPTDCGGRSQGWNR